MKAIWTEVSKVIVGAFPDVPVIPSFGSNDFVDQNLPPLVQDDPYSPYSYLYELWFENIPANKKLLLEKGKTSEVKETFETGGWYEYPLSANISVLSINSIYWNSEVLNSTSYPLYFTDSAPPKAQLEWLRKVFDNNNNLPKSDQKDFIIQMHLPPGVKYSPES